LIATARFRLAAALCVAAAAYPTLARAGFLDRFTDATDGRFDASDYLLRHRGVLPLPLIVTEPAIGYGGGLGLAYFSQSFEESAEAARAKGERVEPPDISMAFGLGTENGTWGGGGAYMGFWGADTWRYLGAAAKAELHLDYYSVNGQPRAYVLETGALVQQLVRRLADTGWFAGARYTYVPTKSRFESQRPDDVPQRELDTAIGKLGVLIDYDTRDNIFTPNTGTFVEMEAGFSRGAFGSDSKFETLYTRAFSWHRMGDNLVIGVRGDARLSRGDVPFYAQPYVVLRGVPAVRYQDRNALVAEGEVRWDVDARWSVVGFAGVGKAYGRRESWSESETVAAGGVGFRYLMARKLNLRAGVDVARGPEDTAVYLTIGSAWR
jgi:hypothetical protein